MKVDLEAQDLGEGAVVLDMLCFCPRLEVLLAKGVSSKDVEKRGPWVCQQLRELKIWFHFESQERHLQALVFERISTLTRLERLIMECPHHILRRSRR